MIPNSRRAKAPVQDEAPVGPHPDKKATRWGGKSWRHRSPSAEKDGGNEWKWWRIGGTLWNTMLFFFGSHIFGRTLKWWMNNSRNALECLGYPMGTLFFRQRCLESRIGGKCIYCTATKLGTFTDMLGITKTTDGDMVCQASSRLSLPAKMGTRLVKIGHGVVGLLLEQRCAKGMLFAWHRWWIGAQALTSI